MQVAAADGAPAQRTGYRPGQVLQLDWGEMPTRPVLAGLQRRAYALVASLPGARDPLARRRANGDGGLEALRILKGHLSDVVYRALKS